METIEKKVNLKRLIISLVLPQVAGIIGSIFTTTAISTWYAPLLKASFSPPNWIFGPVWFLLYVLMGISIYLIWQEIEKNERAKSAIIFFGIHLIFNTTWSIVFFGLHKPGLALVNILIIWLFIILLMVKFWYIKKWSTYLLVPYLLWVSFAGVLNYFIWFLN